MRCRTAAVPGLRRAVRGLVAQDCETFDLGRSVTRRRKRRSDYGAHAIRGSPPSILVPERIRAWSTCVDMRPPFGAAQGEGVAFANARVSPLVRRGSRLSSSATRRAATLLALRSNSVADHEATGVSRARH